MTDERLQPGQLLAGKYRIEHVLGEGGMGVVVAAKHEELGRKVAIKILLPEFARSAEHSARFSREAQAGVKLTSEHSVQVSDVGKLPDGTPFMVMEFLTGKDLGVVLSERGPLPTAEAVDYILQACEGIAEAHSHGIIHRDIKPQNLFLTHRVDGTPLIKVLDFGLNKGIDNNDKGLTKSHSIFGSPLYMSPEQMKASRDVDGRTDIYAIGACLYELLTGAGPFDAPTIAELMIKVIQEPPVSPRQKLGNIPEPLSLAILRCLEKDPARRFQRIDELAAAIAPFGTEVERAAVTRITNIFRMTAPAGTSVTPAVPTPPPTAAPVVSAPSAPVPVASAPPLVTAPAPLDAAKRTDSAWGAPAPAPRPTSSRRGLVFALLGVGALFLAGGGVLAYSYFDSGPAPRSSPHSAGSSSKPSAPASGSASHPNAPPSGSNAADEADAGSRIKDPRRGLKPQ